MNPRRCCHTAVLAGRRIKRLSENAVHLSHPRYGDLVTSNPLIRQGRWLFRGTLVPLDDVLSDIATGLSVDEVWEKHGSLDRRDLEGVIGLSFGEHAHALGTRRTRRAAA
ncbi:DUF433 domain-containing protein [Aurantimonas endophytica]